MSDGGHQGDKKRVKDKKRNKKPKKIEKKVTKNYIRYKKDSGFDFQIR